MQHDTMRDTLRKGIVGKSIQILRTHGKSDAEIKSMMLKDFSISEKALEELLETEKNK